MKICYLADASSIHTQRWVNFFAKRDHDVYLITIASIDASLFPNVKIHTFAEKFPVWKKHKNILAVAKLIREINPDILHSHWVCGEGFWGVLSGYHPHVVTAWGSDIKIFPNKSIIIKLKTMFTLKMVDCITCDAEHMAASMEKLGAVRNKINIIYFGTDVEQFNPNKKDLGIRQDLKIDTNSPLVISTRSLNPVYDVETLVKSVPYVLKEIPQATFVVAGEGTQKQYLVKMSESLGIRKSIRFVGSLQSHAMARALASCDVYVSTAVSDGGIAASTAEAMASGLPVIITDVGNNRQWVKDGEQGFIIPVSDSQLLGNKIVELLKNPHLRKRFGEINREIIVKKNNYYVEMGKMEDIYYKLAMTFFPKTSCPVNRGRSAPLSEK
jgi:glycosyltransferase involved in cell wall biosynthesis